MTDSRPDPDALLAQARAEEASRSRGKLKIFFGAAPGVGKTYAMLQAAREASSQGLDVVVGYVEPHARPDTQALVLGLEVLARKSIEYRGTTLIEFDLERALERRPRLLIVDELAHTNAPGSTHPKRWQDVEDLLRAGIDVYTTLNVQHLESLNDIVAQITSVVVRETVPDSAFDGAHEVEIVDLPPDDLLDRLAQGKVYIPQEATRAVSHFFRRGNLLALREIALRRTAERVGSQVEGFRRAHAGGKTWAVSDRLLVCVSPSPLSKRLVRAACRLAGHLKAPWLAANVETPANAGMSVEDRRRLLENLRLAEDLGAKTTTLSGQDAASEIVDFARRQNVTKILVGKPLQPLWKEALRGSFVYKVTRRCGDIDVYVISGEPDEPEAPRPRPARPRRRRSADYLWPLLVVAACTALGFLMQARFASVNIVMVYLLGVVGVSLRFGPGPSILASVLSVAAFDVFFVPPYLTFAVADTEYIITFAVMLGTGLVITSISAKFRAQVESSRRREKRTAALYSLARGLTAADSKPQVLGVLVRESAALLDSEACTFLPHEDSTLRLEASAPETFRPSEKERAVAQWSYSHGQSAGLGTYTLPGATGLYIPLKSSRKTLGVLGIHPLSQGRNTLEPEQMEILETFAAQAAAALERVRLSQEAEQAQVLVETERLRNSLLSAVSHDLRTPLSAIAGATSTLLQSWQQLEDATRRELLETVVEESESLNRLVANLLEATRIEAGGVELMREWQSVEEIAGSVLQRFGSSKRSKDLVVKIPGDLPLVLADGALVQEVIYNLLDNALKYSPPETPVLLAASLKPGAPPLEPGEILFEVSDQGPGLAAGDEERVFERFYRGSRRGHRGGVGLGLAISKAIVTLHGGRIWAENRPGRGAVFRFTLPLKPQPPVASEENGESGGQDDGR